MLIVSSLWSWNGGSYHTHHKNMKLFHTISISSMTLTFINMHHIGKLIQFIRTHLWHWLDIPSLLKSKPTTRLHNPLKSHIFKRTHNFLFKENSTPHYWAKTPSHQNFYQVCLSSHLMKLNAYLIYQDVVQHEKHAIW